LPIQEAVDTKIDWIFSEKQTQALDLLDVSDEVLYGGAKGGGKSVLGCRWLYLQCKNLITQFNLIPQKYPLAVAFMGRKRAKDFRETTLETWKKFIPSNLYDFKEHLGEIVIEGCVKIIVGGLDSEEAIKKFNSAEYAYIFIDQAEELTRDDYGMLKGTLRLKIDNKQFPYKMLLTANPSDCFLRDDFVHSKNGKQYLQALPVDNPFLATGYIENLTDAFKHRAELLEAYLHGNWDVLEGSENKVIKSHWIRDAVDRELNYNPTTKVTVADIGAGGDDTVIYDMLGYEITKTDISGEKDTMKTAGRIIIHFNDYNSDMIVVDKCGLGLGVYDRVRELLGDKKHLVMGINSAERPTLETEEVKFLNQRAQMWWYVGDLFSQCLTTIPNDNLLIQELQAPNYEIVSSSGKIKIEAKDEIKSRIGRSTDRADTYVMGCWAQQYVNARKNFNRTRTRHPQGRV